LRRAFGSSIERSQQDRTARVFGRILGGPEMSGAHRNRDRRPSSIRATCRPRYDGCLGRIPLIDLQRLL